MAFNTKIELYDSKVYQCDGHVLTLSGNTVIATVGDLRYQTHPTFTGNTQIVDKQYVDSATGGICASNGLTKSGSYITLGGALTGETTINGAHTLRMNVCTLNLTGTTGFALSTGNGVITDSGNKGGLQYATCYDAYVVKLSIPNAGWVTGKTSTSGIQSAGNGLTKAGTNVVLGGTISGATIITDSRGAGSTLGIQYGGDYSAGFNARSLVDVGYVSSQTSGITTGYLCCANNGLNKAGQNVRLGGALTGTTTINGAQTLRMNVCYFNITGSTGFCVSTGCGVITDTGTNGGLKYAASYDTNVVALSIPNAAYVTGKTQAVISCFNPVITTAITGATNGLCKFDSRNVCLGGALSSNIIIGTGTCTFGVCAAKANLTGTTVN
jgi:hypothetical protein